MKKCIILFLLGFGIWSLGFEKANAFSINLDPPSINLAIPAGQSQTGSLRIENTGQEVLNVSVYTEDWIYAPDGSKNFKSAGTTRYSCAKWINLYPTNFELLPGQSKDVKYTATMPQAASGGYVGVIFFDSTVAKENLKQKSSVIFSGRIGSIIYLENPKNLVKKGSISQLETTAPDENKPMEIKISIKNEGNTHLSAKASMVIVDKDGKIFGRADLGRINALPGQTSTQKFGWYGKLAQGEYDIVTTLDYSGPDIATELKHIKVKKGGSIADFDIKTVNKNVVKCYLKYNNNGNLAVNISGSIAFVNENNKTAKTIYIGNNIVLPGASKNIELFWKGYIPKGNYKVFLSLNSGSYRDSRELTYYKEK